MKYTKEDLLTPANIFCNWYSRFTVVGRTADEVAEYIGIFPDAYAFFDGTEGKSDQGVPYVSFVGFKTPTDEAASFAKALGCTVYGSTDWDKCEISSFTSDGSTASYKAECTTEPSPDEDGYYDIELNVYDFETGIKVAEIGGGLRDEEDRAYCEFIADHSRKYTYQELLAQLKETYRYVSEYESMAMGINELKEDAKAGCISFDHDRIVNGLITNIIFKNSNPEQYTDEVLESITDYDFAAEFITDDDTFMVYVKQGSDYAIGLIMENLSQSIPGIQILPAMQAAKIIKEDSLYNPSTAYTCLDALRKLENIKQILDNASIGPFDEVNKLSSADAILKISELIGA